jgi:hypothetical protein
MKLIKDIGLIFLLAILWFGPAYYASEALLPGWGLQCGLTSLITGLMGLAIINRTEEGRRLFFNGQTEDDQISCVKVLIWFLIGIPIMLLVTGTLWWIMRLLGVFDFK